MHAFSLHAGSDFNGYPAAARLSLRLFGPMDLQRPLVEKSQRCVRVVILVVHLANCLFLMQRLVWRRVGWGARYLDQLLQQHLLVSLRPLYKRVAPSLLAAD